MHLNEAPCKTLEENNGNRKRRKKKEKKNARPLQVRHNNRIRRFTARYYIAFVLARFIRRDEWQRENHGSCVRICVCVRTVERMVEEDLRFLLVTNETSVNMFRGACNMSA